jgi:hypothetical protein
MRTSSVAALLGLLVAGCASQEGVELFMAAGYFKTNGHVMKKGANGRDEILFISTTAAMVPKAEHEQRHFAALQGWLGEKSLCRRGYRKLHHFPGSPRKEDLGGTVEPIAARTMQTMIACK